MMNEQEEERMQIKCNYDIGRLHIQGVSSTVKRGRKYGIALKMRTADDGAYQIFIKGSEANHPEGAMLDLQPLDQPVQQLLEFVTEAEMVIDAVGPRYVSTNGDEEE